MGGGDTLLSLELRCIQWHAPAHADVSVPPQPYKLDETPAYRINAWGAETFDYMQACTW